jgi:hypothetical protein
MREFGVVAYDVQGEFTPLSLKTAKWYSLVARGDRATHQRAPGFFGTDFLCDQVLKTAERLPRWFLSGNVTPARWLGRTASKPRKNGRDYLEITPKSAAACFAKHNKRLPAELGDLLETPV